MRISAKIDPAKTYALSQIVKLKLVPGKKSYTAISNMVMRDRFGANLLEAQMMGEGNATRIYIKGENLIKFIQSL